jgi:hypothetical protein
VNDQKLLVDGGTLGFKGFEEVRKLGSLNMRSNHPCPSLSKEGSLTYSFNSDHNSSGYSDYYLIKILVDRRLSRCFRTNAFVKQKQKLPSLDKEGQGWFNLLTF